MPYQATTATHKVLGLKKRIRAVSGGTSASKTISILMVLIDYAQSTKTPKLISVVSESIPHLKRGAMRDFENILKEQGYWDESAWNRTDFIYTFHTGSKIEFFGADSPDKVRGPRRDVLYINEANNVDYSAFDQLEVRTKGFIFLDWNPVGSFWFYEEVLPNRSKDIDFITLTYKDNEALAQSIVESIEARQPNARWWKVYGLGELGENDERIYTGWALIDDIPHEARLIRYGLDFGYTIDPTAIVAVYEHNGGYIIDEVCYQKGLSNKSIADILNNHPQAIVFADSAEPKSIDEIRSYGIGIYPAQKGPGSVFQGIQNVQSKRISITNRSINTIKAYRNYNFRVDKQTGKPTNDPDDSVHEWSNSMDAIRYAFNDLLQVTQKEKKQIVTVGANPYTGWGGRSVIR